MSVDYVVHSIDVAHLPSPPNDAVVGTIVYALSQVVKGEYFLMRTLESRIHPSYCRVTFANDDEMIRYLDRGGEQVERHTWDRLLENMHLAMDINDIDYWSKEGE